MFYTTYSLIIINFAGLLARGEGYKLRSSSLCIFFSFR